MERLSIAESDIASLKDDYIDLKEDFNSLKASASSYFENGMDHDLEDIKVSMEGNPDIKAVVVNSLNMMSVDMMSMSKGRGLSMDSNISYRT